MASAFAHAFLAYTIGRSYPKKDQLRKFLFLGAFCAVIPDADVVMFKLGVPYEHFLGHRGFSHSLVFALLLGIAVTILFYRDLKLFSKRGMSYVLFFFLCAASHILLDAMTTGGLGVAAFSPFDNNRYFLPWRPIKVSPIGVGRFISARGVSILINEFLWVGLPCLIFMLLLKAFRKKDTTPQ